MDEKIKNPERNKLKTGEKLEWETPKLICLDKGKTEGGFTTGMQEDDTYSNPAS